MCRKVPVCLPLTLSPRPFFCHCIFSKAFSRTLLRKRFGLIQILKAQTAGCDVGFSFDRGDVSVSEPQQLFKSPLRSNAARMRNMSRLNGGKLPGNSKHFLKKSKDKAVPGKRSFKH